MLIRAGRGCVGVLIVIHKSVEKEVWPPQRFVECRGEKLGHSQETMSQNFTHAVSRHAICLLYDQYFHRRKHFSHLLMYPYTLVHI